jgi:CheY-like chemotaxis protein
MPTTEKNFRVLIVGDNRDGADALGLLVEELGNQVHVTYGGTKALEVVGRIASLRVRTLPINRVRLRTGRETDRRRTTLVKSLPALTTEPLI